MMSRALTVAGRVGAGSAAARALRCSRRAVRRLPGVRDERALPRAVRERVQPAPRLHGAPLVRPRGVPRLGGLRHGLRRPRAGGSRPSSACSPAPRSRRCSGSSSGASRSAAPGIYFAMITLGFAQLVYFLVVQMPWTGGEDGLQGDPARQGCSGSSRSIDPIDDVLLRVRRVPRRLLAHPPHHPLAVRPRAPRRSARTSRARSRSATTSTATSSLAFVLSAALAGLAGSLKAVVLQFASLSDVHWHRSGEVVLMTLLGGMGTVVGPSVGALLVVALENYLADVGSWVTVITGVVFVVCVLAFRRGIVGEVRALVARSFTGLKRSSSRHRSESWAESSRIGSRSSPAPRAASGGRSPSSSRARAPR